MSELERVYSDEELLDHLQEMLDKSRYTGEAILRWSTTGRGMRLHETSMDGAVASIRGAITKHLRQEEERG